ncbi:MAG: AAA family ATPase [Candidatus Micrarchaeia archaeon]
MADIIVKLVIGITGTPGVGKSYFSNELKKHTSINVVELNNIVRKHKLFYGFDKDKSMVVKLDMLNTYTKREINRSKKSIALVGHLVPELKIKFDILIVLRLDLNGLLLRFQKRGYTNNKLKENIVAEALDYCGEKAKNKKIAKEIYEIESSDPNQRKELINYIKMRLCNIKADPPNLKTINYMPQLYKLAKGGKYGF